MKWCITVPQDLLFDSWIALAGESASYGVHARLAVLQIQYSRDCVLSTA
jgi:hypothetical protein